MRAAQSKGIADLLALWPLIENPVYGEGRYELRAPWLVQAKYTITEKRAFLSAMERESLIALAEATGGVPVLARPGPKGRGVEFINLYNRELIV